MEIVLSLHFLVELYKLLLPFLLLLLELLLSDCLESLLPLRFVLIRRSLLFFLLGCIFYILLSFETFLPQKFLERLASVGIKALTR